MAKNEIEILVTAEVDKAIKNIKKTEEQTKKSSKGIGSALSSIKTGYLAIAVAVAGAIKVVNKFVELAGEQEKQEKALAQAMKQAGTFTKKAYEENLKYASSLQKITKFGDENILTVQRKLTNFGLEGKALRDVTKATLDLATATGMDLKSAGDLVAKSVGSSTNAMARYGIAIEGVAGSSERAESTVKAITELFGGSAEADAKTYAGRLQQMQNSFGDMQEEIGFHLLPILRKLFEFLTPVFGKLGEMIEQIDDINDKFSISYRIISAYSRVFKILGSVVQISFLQPLRVAINGMQLFGGTIVDIVKGLNNLRKGVKDPFKGFGEGIKENLKDFRDSFTKPYKDIVLNTKTLYQELKEGRKKDTDDAIDSSVAKGKADDKLTKQKIDNANKVLSTSSDITSQLSAISDLALQNEQTKLDNKHAQEMEKLDTQLENKLISEEEYEKSKSELEKKQAEETKKFKQKEWKLNKAFSFTEALINTALGVTKSLTVDPTGILASIVGALGLAQSGLIAGQTMPAFADGGTMQESGLAMVGERGAELVHLPAGAKVHNNSDTKSMLNNNNFSVSNITLPNVSSGAEFYEELQQLQREYGSINFGN